MAIVGSYCDGFEHQAPSVAGAGVFYTLANASIVTTAGSARTGAAHLRVAITAAASGRALIAIPGTLVAKRVFRCYWRYAALPAVGSAVPLCYLSLASLASAAQVRLTSSGTLQAAPAGAAAEFTANAASPTLAANTWHLIEVQFDASLATFPMSLRVNGTLVGTFAASAAQTTSTISRIGFGDPASTSATVTYDYDDLVVGTYTDAANDWFGDGSVVALLPDSDRAHVTAASIFRYTDNNGTATTPITNATTASWSRLTDWPVIADGNAADTWVEKFAGTVLTDHLQYGFANPTPTATPQCFSAIVALKSTSTTANSATLTPLSPAGALYATPIFNATIGSATTIYKSMGYGLNQAGAPLTLADITDLGLRFTGIDALPSLLLKAAIVQVAFPAAVSGVNTARTIAATATSVAGDILGIGKDVRGTAGAVGSDLLAATRTILATTAATGRDLLAVSLLRLGGTAAAGTVAAARTYARALVASVTASGAGARALGYQRALAASAGALGTLVRSGTFARTFAATTTATGRRALAATWSRAVTVAASGATTAARAYNRAATATASVAGILGRTTGKAPTASVGATGKRAVAAARALLATAGAVGARALSGTRAIATQVTATGRRVLAGMRTLVASANAVGTRAALVAYARTLLATTTATGRLGRATARGIAAATGAVGSAATTFGAGIQAFARTIGAAVGATGTLRRAIGWRRVAPVGAGGLVARSIARTVVGAVAASGSATATFVAAVQAYARTITATLGATATRRADVARITAAVVASGGTTVRGIARSIASTVGAIGRAIALVFVPSRVGQAKATFVAVSSPSVRVVALPSTASARIEADAPPHVTITPV